jgi:hypothetical protein
MHKSVWRGALAFVLAVVVIAAFILLRNFRKPSASALLQRPSVAHLEEQDLPPLPVVSLQINSKMDLEVFRGTPLIITVRVANPRAANAAASNLAHGQYLVFIQEKVAKGELSATDAKPMLELARRKQEIRTVRLGTREQGWSSFLHFELQSAGSRPEPLSWPLIPVAAPEAQILALDADTTAQIDYALAPEAAAPIPAGDYNIVAALEVPTGTNLPPEIWRGRVSSRPVKLRVLPVPAQPSSVDQANISLQRAEFFSTTKDWTSALSNAQEALAANPKLIRAHIIGGEAREAQGDLSGARHAFGEARRLFYEQHPNSYEAPLYLISKIITLDQQLGGR